MYFSAELKRRRELGIVFRKRDKGSGQHIEDKEEKLKYPILIKSKFIIENIYTLDLIYIVSFSRCFWNIGSFDKYY